MGAAGARLRVVVDSGYDSYDAERRILAPLPRPDAVRSLLARSIER